MAEYDSVTKTHHQNGELTTQSDNDDRVDFEVDQNIQIDVTELDIARIRVRFQIRRLQEIKKEGWTFVEPTLNTEILAEKPVTFEEEIKQRGIQAISSTIADECCEITFGQLSVSERLEVSSVLMQPVQRYDPIFVGTSEESPLSSHIYFTMLINERHFPNALYRTRQLYDYKSYWIIDTKVTLRDVKKAAHVLGRGRVLNYIDCLVDSAAGNGPNSLIEEHYLDIKVETLSMECQLSLINRIYASESEFEGFLIALGISPETVNDYTNLKNDAVKTTYYYYHEHPELSLGYILNVAKTCFMKPSVRNLYVFPPMNDLINRKKGRFDVCDDQVDAPIYENHNDDKWVNSQTLYPY